VWGGRWLSTDSHTIYHADTNATEYILIHMQQIILVVYGCTHCIMLIQMQQNIFCWYTCNRNDVMCNNILQCLNTSIKTWCLDTKGWLRLVGSLKLLVSFAEYSLFYRALLQKRPVILRSLLIVAIPQCQVYRFNCRA